MEDIEPPVFDDLTGGAAEDREKVEVLAAATGLPELTTLGLGPGGAFFTASDTDARGRATVLVFPFVELTEPVGETVELRIAVTTSEDCFVFVEADREAFGAGETEDFVGTTEALRVGAAGVAADFKVEDIAGRDVAAGADVDGFFKGGAAAFDKGVVAVTLEPEEPEAGLAEVGLTEPAPNVPELII
jgi:hypothetical protein